MKHKWNDSLEEYKELLNGIYRSHEEKRKLYYSIYCIKCKSKFSQINKLRLDAGISIKPAHDNDEFFSALMRTFDHHYPCEDMRLKNLLG